MLDKVSSNKPAAPKGKKAPHPIDIHVGSRVRLRRMLLNISQEKLAERLGITFQQIQKYEKGTNRISASRLHQMSSFLNVPPAYFFEEGENISVPADVETGDIDSETGIMSYLASREGLRLNRAFAKIKDADVRKRLTDLAVVLAGGDIDE